MRIPSPRSVALVLEGLVTLVAARTGVRAFSLATLREAGHLGVGLFGRTPRDDDPGAVALCRAIERASRVLPGRTTCLAKALAAKAMLGRRGMDAQVRIGVRKTESDVVEAHAWVEHHGAVVIGGDPGAFSPFSRPL